MPACETDWIVTKCVERGLNIQETYPVEYEARGNSRTRIDEIDDELENFQNLH